MTYEDQRGVEVFVVLLDIVRVILGRLLLVHRIEIETGVVVLDRLEERPESILEAMFVQRETQSYLGSQTYHFGSICSGGDSFSSLSPFLPLFFMSC